MNRTSEQPRAYLLRLRRLDNGGRPVWFFTLESTDGSARHEFRGLQALNDFLALVTYRVDDGERESTTEDEQWRKRP